jgi:thiamine-phosphate pyrophosphorylase
MNGDVLRILDANANRAREGLRVIEDYARFVLDDAGLCGELKAIRHEFGDALTPLLADAILWRDTPGDVGTSTKTQAELARDDASHVVTAAGKRLGEALRTIEEYLKTADPSAAGKIERIRYRFYDIEQRISRTLRPTQRFANVRLYVLITETACRIPWEQAAKQAIEGGADCLQLREKGLDGKELLARAKQFVSICRAAGVISIINDRPDIAILSGADGVHVGQEDLPAIEARRLLGAGKIVGVSTHNLSQAKQAVLDGADYIGVGPFFKSETKPRNFIAGPAFARDAAAQIHIPSVAIAGITEDNLDEVLTTGIQAVAVTAAVVGCTDVRAAAQRMKQKLLSSSRDGKK